MGNELQHFVEMSDFEMEMDKAEKSAAAMEYYERGDFETAASLFRALAKEGNASGKNNLAYMIRRNEVPAEKEPVIIEAMELLREGVGNMDVFNMTNMALIFALNLGKESDWRIADDLMAEIPMSEAQQIWNWWEKLSRSGEVEGDLVLLWLLRHKKVAGSPAENIQDLWKRLQEKLDTIPQWLNEIL